VSAGARYALGAAGVALATFAIGLLLAPPARAAGWIALGLALPVQLPLGWWLVRAVGSDGLLLAWAVGMMGRIGVLVVAAWIVAPLAGVPLGPLLITLAAVLLALLGVEAAVLTHRVRHDGVR
jgi:hypothetical protein